jgi:hypothetical protein
MGSGKIGTSPQKRKFRLAMEKEWIKEALVFYSRIGIVFAGLPYSGVSMAIGASFRQFENPTAKLASHPCITDLSLTSKTLKSTDLNRCKGSIEIEQISSFGGIQ